MLKQQFLQAIRRLHEAQVEFVVVGGVALQLHGGAHMTEDIDFSFAPAEENRKRLAETMNGLHPRPLGWPSQNAFRVTVSQLAQVRFLNLKTDIGDIDLLPLPSGIDTFEGLWERATVMEIDGMPTRIASLDDLIAMKKAAGRPKDERHLMELAALKRVIAEEQNS